MKKESCQRYDIHIKPKSYNLELLGKFVVQQHLLPIQAHMKKEPKGGSVFSARLIQRAFRRVSHSTSIAYSGTYEERTKRRISI